MIFVGDDWSEDHHDVCLMDQAGKRLASRRLASRRLASRRLASRRLASRRLPEGRLPSPAGRPPRVTLCANRLRGCRGLHCCDRCLRPAPLARCRCTDVMRPIPRLCIALQPLSRLAPPLTRCSRITLPVNVIPPYYIISANMLQFKGLRAWVYEHAI